MEQLFLFKSEYDSNMRQYLDTKMSGSLIDDNPVVREIVEHMHKLLLEGGKRARPYVAYLTYLSVCKSEPEEEKVMAILVGLELFHMFALVHDDIIDRGGERHGIPTLHKHVAKDENEHYGLSQAILGGDMLFNWAWEIFAIQTNIAVKQDVCTVFARMVDEVIAGQMLDVELTIKADPSLDAILKKTELKTAHYTFTNPIKMGMALAGVLNYSNERLAKNLGIALGMAFQLQDDLLDIIGDPSVTGKGNFKDLEEKQHSCFTHHIRRDGSKGDIKILESLRGRRLSEADKKQAAALFARGKALSEGKKQINLYLDEAKDIVAEWSLDPARKTQWLAVIDYLRMRTN